MRERDISNLLIEIINKRSFEIFLDEINQYFYNRKQELQIRDQILKSINSGKEYFSISEYPKGDNGKAVDLSIYTEDMQEKLATVELKFHYPKDLNYKAALEAILKDIEKEVETITSHFILILQYRKIIEKPEIGEIKYIERSMDKDFAPYLNKLESLERFPRFKKEISSITVESRYLISTYTFVVYRFTSDSR